RVVARETKSLGLNPLPSPPPLPHPNPPPLAGEGREGAPAGENSEGARPLAPMFQPFRLRGLTLENRVVVSPMCQYSAQDGLPNDWHLVHYGSRAIGGAGLIFTEMTDVSREARISLGCAGMYNDAHEAAWKSCTPRTATCSRASSRH